MARALAKASQALVQLSAELRSSLPPTEFVRRAQLLKTPQERNLIMDSTYPNARTQSASSGRLKDQPVSERPRERLIASGPSALSPAELMAILLRTGLQGRNAVEIGKDLLQRFGSLTALARASVDDLCEVRGVGRDKAVTLVAAFNLATRMAEELRWESPVLSTPEEIVKLLRQETRLKGVETFQVLLLNTRLRLIRIEQISQGTLDAALVDAREVFKPAIAARASSIVLAHNHPSGDPTPSSEDISITKRLIKAGELLNISVLDHIILGCASAERPHDYVSLRELGLV